MSSLFNEMTIKTIRQIRKLFLWAAVFILIGEIVAGAIIILTQQYNLFVGKLMVTFGLCVIVFFVGVNNFSRMEKCERIVQSFALVSLVLNIVWLSLAIMFIWEVIPFLEGPSAYSYGVSLSVMAKTMLVSANIATMPWYANYTVVFTGL